MPKGPKGKSPPSIYNSIDVWAARPARKKLNAEQKRERMAAAVQVFTKQYARKAQRGAEPNDRRYDRGSEGIVSRMRPEHLDDLLRNGEDGD